MTNTAVLFTSAMIGIVVGSAGAALAPGIAQLAAPIVCDGTLETKTQSVTGGSRTHITCVAPDGTSERVNAGLVSLVIAIELFVPLAVIGLIVVRKRRTS